MTGLIFVLSIIGSISVIELFWIAMLLSDIENDLDGIEEELENRNGKD